MEEKNKNDFKPFVLSKWKDIIATNCGGQVKFKIPTRHSSVGAELTGDRIHASAAWRIQPYCLSNKN